MRKTTKNLNRLSLPQKKRGLEKVKDEDLFVKHRDDDLVQIKKIVEDLIKSVNTISTIDKSEKYGGKPGDLKVIKKGKNKYDFIIKGEDGWYRDTNSSFAPMDKEHLNEQNQMSIQQNDDGTITHKYRNFTRFTVDLDAGTVAGVATPTLKSTGNLNIDSSGTLTLKAGSETSAKNIKINPSLTTQIESPLSVSTIAAADSDTDKFLVSDNGTVKYRTGTQLLSDIGGGAGDITGVSITTDSGSGSKAEDTAGSADFSLLGSNGVGVTNSGTTITAVAVPGEIDHDSLNNFVANEHIDWTGASAGTIHATNYTNTTYSEATGSAEGLMSIAHHDKLDGIEANATADQTKSDIDGLAITTVGALDTGSIASGFGAIDNGSSNITTTGTISGGTINGSAIWQSFPFMASSITASRGFYFRDNNDPEDFRKWDDFDADMVLVYGKIYGHYIVPEDCTLTHMRGIVANDGSTDDVIINVWYCLQTNIQTDTTSTTFTKAGSDTDVTIGTSEVGVQFNEDYDVDLTAGSIVIPSVKNGGAGSDSFLGSLTLKFITR
jgi:hypothetical protein